MSKQSQQRKRKRLFEKALIAPAADAWAGAQRDMKEYGDFALFAHAISFFPEGFQFTVEDSGLAMNIVSSKEMKKILHQAIREGRTSFFRNPLVRTYGLFDGRDAEIHVVLGNLPEKFMSIPLSWQTTLDVTGHELCHFADWWCYHVSTWSKSFNECYETDKCLFDKETSSSKAEFFASAGWICLRYPELAAEHMPVTAKWFEEYWGGKACDETTLSRSKGLMERYWSSWTSDL